MSITVLLQKTKTFYVPKFSFGGLIFNKKFRFQTAYLKCLPFLPKTIIFRKFLWLQVEGYVLDYPQSGSGEGGGHIYAQHKSK